jgi:Ca2+-transporting ATPase
MTATTTIEQPAGGGLTWYALSAQDVTAQMGVDADTGLTVAEVERRQAEYGPNELATEPPPSMWVMAREQLMDPMNIMLLIVVAPAVVAVDKAIQLRRQNKAPVGGSAELKASPAVQAST